MTTETTRYFGIKYGSLGPWTKGDFVPEYWFTARKHDVEQMLEQGVIFGPTGGPCNKPELLVDHTPAKTTVDPSPALEAEVARLTVENKTLAADNARLVTEAAEHARQIAQRDKALGGQASDIAVLRRRNAELEEQLTAPAEPAAA